MYVSLQCEFAICVFTVYIYYYTLSKCGFTVCRPSLCDDIKRAVVFLIISEAFSLLDSLLNPPAVSVSRGSNSKQNRLLKTLKARVCLISRPEMVKHEHSAI